MQQNHTMELATEAYLKSVRSLCNSLTDTELAFLTSKLTLKEFNRKEYFLKSGKIQKSIGFIASGLVRSYFVDKDENEINVGFYAEGDYATHYHAFLLQTSSLYSIQCLEPTTFVCLSYEDMQQVYGQSLNFERYGRLVAEEILKRQQARIESFIFQTAEERYLDFVQRHPTLFNRISLSQLSSYLGIERQSLTRIRQHIAHK